MVAEAVGGQPLIFNILFYYFKLVFLFGFRFYGQIRGV